jgi:glycosyltransferase involved in cell wall biosynthesis
VLFVSSWAFDEPIAAALEACRSLRGRVNVRVTGRPKAAYAKLLEGRPDNFIPTGFLSDADYFDLMARCDAVLCVTSRECTLVCGAYEAVALGKPMILGDTEALRSWFDSGALYTDGTAADLARLLGRLEEDLPALEQGVRALLPRRDAEWEERLASLEWLLRELGEPADIPRAGNPLPASPRADADAAPAARDL